MKDLICVSHLRWDFVWQRPQQILSRLAQHYRVTFVEEPISSEEAHTPKLDIYTWKNGDTTVDVVRLIQPVDHNRWIGHGDPACADIYNHLLQAYLQKQKIHDPILWLYTPMAYDFVDVVQPDLLVYDVMDQLSAFQGAPTALKERERVLLQKADVVFTGGVSLYRSKYPFNPNTHLLPSGVDVDHYAQAADVQTFDCPGDIAALPRPILGYFGVIDERLDLALLEHLAWAHPEWTIVMIGPVVKITPSALPQARNLHYPGMKTYAELPAYLAHFDVALIPFAMNEATRYVSPTKTLEYMAAHKPIVSTPIRDVIELYGDVVSIGHTPEEFTAHIEAILQGKEDRAARRAQEDQLLAQHTWDVIAERMSRLMARRPTSKSSITSTRIWRSVGD